MKNLLTTVIIGIALLTVQINSATGQAAEEIDVSIGITCSILPDTPGCENVKCPPTCLMADQVTTIDSKVLANNAGKVHHNFVLDTTKIINKAQGNLTKISIDGLDTLTKQKQITPDEQKKIKQIITGIKNDVPVEQIEKILTELNNSGASNAASLIAGIAIDSYKISSQDPSGLSKGPSWADIGGAVIGTLLCGIGCGVAGGVIGSSIK